MSSQESITKILNEAVELQSLGDIAKARELFLGVLQQEPKNFIALHSMGVLAYNASQFYDALRYCNAALEVNTSFATTYFVRASSHQQLQNIKQAQLDIERALSLDPMLPGAQSLKAVLDQTLAEQQPKHCSNGFVKIIEKIQGHGFSAYLESYRDNKWKAEAIKVLTSNGLLQDQNDINKTRLEIVFLNQEDLLNLNQLLSEAKHRKSSALLLEFEGKSDSYGYLETVLGSNGFETILKEESAENQQGERKISLFATYVDSSPHSLNYYHTYFDSNYLTRAMLMLESLMKWDPNALVNVLCLDTKAFNFLTAYSPKIHPIKLEELTESDPEFAASRNNRTLVEWYFTTTSVLTSYIFKTYPEIPRTTYLDSDLFFFTSPEILHHESKGKSVQIIEHRFTPGLESLSRYGRFNVAWISFFNTEEGLRVINDYRKNCIDWCKDIVEEDRFADQKYLDRWPLDYKDTCVSRWIGGDVSHWNVAQWPISKVNDRYFIDNEALIFYHFQGVKLQKTGSYGLSGASEGLGIYMDLFYKPYIDKMNTKEEELKSILEGVNRASIRYKDTEDETSSDQTKPSQSIALANNSRKPTIVFVGTCYSAFLENHYRENPNLSNSTYKEQLASIIATRFGDSDFYSNGMTLAGWTAVDVIANAEQLQTAWANENQLHGGLLDVLIAQIKYYMPDVVYFQDMSMCTRELLEVVRPHTQLIAGQIASPIFQQTYLAGFDLIFSSFPHFVERFNQQGIRSYYQPLAFDSRILENFGERNPDIEFSFVGGISPHHTKGTELLSQIAETTPLQLWGYGSQFLPEESLLKNRHQGEAWGLGMFRLLQRSRITLNRHIDTAENNANNMRLFESTGMGALLITDDKKNISDLYKVNKEILIYKDSKECKDKVNYFLKNQKEAEEIAKEGQRKTLDRHSYISRMRKTKDILEKLI